MSRETYSVVLEPAAGGFGVTFPLFPGCVSFGRSQREAIANGTEALLLHIGGMIEDGEQIPLEGYEDGRQTNIDHAAGAIDWEKNPEKKLNVYTFVMIDIENKGGERVNVYLPRHLVAAVDRFASRNGMTRSSVFGIATRRYLDAEGAQSVRE